LSWLAQRWIEGCVEQQVLAAPRRLDFASECRWRCVDSPLGGAVCAFSSGSVNVMDYQCVEAISEVTESQWRGACCPFGVVE
jgi:hypothetical protein